MRRFLFLFISLLSLLSASSANKPSKELALFISDMVEEQNIHPDSFYVGIARLEARKESVSDPTEKAITQAVLGYVYQKFAYKSSALEYQSPSDETKMEAWSYDDYMRMSAQRYAEALSDLDVLHKTTISQWAPLTEKGKDDAIYNNDMLMLVWRHAQDVSFRNKEIPSRANIIKYYEKLGNRKAVLWLKIEESSSLVRTEEIKRLKELKDEYADLDMCAEVYLSLSNVEYDSKVRVDWLEKGLKLYPRYKYKSRLSESLQQLQTPDFYLTLSSGHPYPGNTYRWIMHMKNVQTVKWQLYRLNKDFDSRQYSKARNEMKYLRKHATLLSDELHQCSQHTPWQQFSDTLSWTSPEVGRYALVVLPSTQMKLKDKTRESVEFIRVSRLVASSISLHDGVERIMVNDGLSGKPVAGATLSFYRTYKNEADTTYFGTVKTDKDGKYDFKWPKDNRGALLSGLEMKVTHGDDCWQASARLYHGQVHFETPSNHSELKLYTDRSIYRPGQTVYVGGVAYSRKDWVEKVLAERDYSIALHDANGKVIAENQVITDSLGVFSTEFALPESGITGTFRITVDGYTRQYVKVEEYKRPTFEVTTDEAPAVQMPADSICLTGRAMMYSGAPVRGAQVVGQFRWDDSYWARWGRPSRSRYDEKLDTVLTDEQGRFKVVVPIAKRKSYLRYGQVLSVHYDVISPSGETHTAEQSIFLSSAPLTLHAQVPDMIDRDKLTPWSMELVTSTGTEVSGEITMTFKKGNKVVFETKEKSGHSVLPTSLKDAPSGRYDLCLQSVVKGDTAQYRTNVVLFSQHDTKLPTDSTLWVYVAEKNMSPGKSARVQVGTSKDVYLYYTLSSNKKVLDDRLIHLTDTLLTFDIPYEESNDKGVVMNVMLVKNEKVYTKKVEIQLQQPDKQLKHKWITFRDRLQPGQQETWQLQLLTPDGKPAHANLMASLYDASLDAINSHGWSFSHPMSYDLFRNGYGVLSKLGSSSLRSSFSLKEYPDVNYSFAAFDNSLFTPNAYGYVKSLGKGRRGKAVYELGIADDGAVYAGAAPMMVMRESVSTSKKSYDENSMGTGAEMVADEEILEVADSEEGNEDVADPAVQLRENFNETAFFYPALRTNEKGEVTISFTLPESLTTWRLLGLAHTQDLLTTILNEEAKAQKDLMAQLSLPRFLRQGDKASLSATIFNISQSAQKGRAVLTILDAETEKVMLKQRINFDIKAQSDTTLLIPYNVPDDASMLICRWVAEGSTCSDGEQRYLPVLSNKEWITESRALTYIKAGNYREDLTKMFPVKDAVNKRLTFEYVSQPVWYAIQALPSLAWPKNEDILSLASAYYAGSISGSIAARNPNILEAINSWKDAGLLHKSKLLQNEELKGIILQETPWIAEAEAETEHIQRLNTLFDEATQSSLQKEYLDKMRKLQNSDGSFSWFPGMSGSYYITREVAYLLTRLKVLNGKAPDNMITQAVGFIRKDRPTHLSVSSLRYLYVLYQSGVQMDKADRHNADSLLKVLVKHPEDLDIEERALAAIVLKKAGKDKNSERYLESVKKFLVTNKEGLTYFEFPQGSHRSINRKLHIHVQVMEAISQLSPQDSVLLDGMRRYLLRHKRTSEWDSPVNTANAVFALLLDNEGALQQGCDAEVSLVGKQKTKVESEGTAFGYVRSQMEVKNDVKSVEIVKKGNQESWGGIYAQYLAPISSVENSEKGELSVKVEVKPERQPASQSASGVLGDLSVGSRVHVRYIITAEKDYEYVVLHAPRPATAEPVSQLSGYNWRGGLAYYRAVKDAAVNFFIDYLPRGSYVIEEDWLVERPGEFSTGITNIQCLYAPEFSAHAKDIKVKVASKK